MRSQFIILYLVIITFISIYFIESWSKNIYYYKPNEIRFILNDFYTKIKMYPLYNKTINETYHMLCKDYGYICYYNGTHIIGKNNHTIYEIIIE